MGAVSVQETKSARFGNRHVADVGEEPRGASRADAVDVHQMRAAGQDCGVELGFHRREFGVEVVQVSDFLGGHAPTGLASQVRGRTASSSARYWAADFFTGAPPGISSRNSGEHQCEVLESLRCR